MPMLVWLAQVSHECGRRFRADAQREMIGNRGGGRWQVALSLLGFPHLPRRQFANIAIPRRDSRCFAAVTKDSARLAAIPGVDGRAC